VGGFKLCFPGIISIAVFIFGTCLSAYSDIYTYIDSAGVLHFTNVPTSSKYSVFMREYPVKALRVHSPDRYDRLINEASATHGISFPLLKAIIKAESGFNHMAVSKAGARGLMQIMPENIKAFKIKNPFDPRENIMAGTRYLKSLLKRFDGRLSFALAAYNAGPSTVDRHQSIPPIKETQDYVRKVLKYYYIFKNG